jgi:hypothetical protein
VHPGGLHDESTGQGVSVCDQITGEGKSSRDSVAAALVACLDQPQTIGRSFALLDGQTPLNEALASL